MEKRSRRRIRDLVTQPASQGLSENEIGCARISIMARGTTAPSKGRIQKRKTTGRNGNRPSGCRNDGHLAQGCWRDFGLS
jgi:hypothetical protein